MAHDAAALVDRGQRALAACDWASAVTAFAQARAFEESAELLDGLGQARYWQGAYAEALPLRERAYALYRRRGDRRAAATVAVQLAQLHGLVYGNATAVSGWLAHAQRMLEDCDECVAHGLFELFLGVIADGPVERERRARAAVRIGRRHDAVGLEHDALGYVGKARIEAGAVADGMRLVDEAVAAVASGLVDDAWAAGSIWCTLFHACELAIDVTRAEQWLASVDHYVERTDELPISAICRMHYGGLLTAAGRWDDAERELTTALAIYDDTYTGTRSEPLLRLAELRARQHRIDEAAQLLSGHEDAPLAVLPRVRVLLARGAPDHARAVLDRHAPSDDVQLVSAPVVALAVEVLLACGAVDDARARAGQLSALADACAVAALTGFAARARAQVAAAGAPVDGVDDDGIDDLQAAVVAFADAGLAHDLAVARLELAARLARVRPTVARGEAQLALDGFRRIGAHHHAEAAARLLARLSDDAPGPSGSGALTVRQREVLGLLADGLSNAQIASRLSISERTVEHHVSAVLSALGVRSRTEAAARALRGQVAV